MKYLKNGLKHYVLYHIIYGSSIATWNLVVPTADPYLGWIGKGYSSEDLDDFDDSTMDTGPQSGDKKPGPKSRGRKRVKGRLHIRKVLQPWHMHGL